MIVYFQEKKITQNDFSVQFSTDSLCFHHVWYVLLPERDDTIFVYRARFSVNDIYSL